jgi:uncharacterized membrane protein YfcA
LAPRFCWLSRKSSLAALILWLVRTKSRHPAGWYSSSRFNFSSACTADIFGAGIGILMLAALELIGLTDLHQMNGLKNLLAICINGVAAIYFAASGAVIWLDALVMAIAAVLGGIAGAKLAQRLGRKFVRAFVVLIGLGMTVALFLKR